MTNDTADDLNLRREGASCVATREIGRRIRARMRDLEMTGVDLSLLLGWTESKLSRTLKGTLSLTTEELSAILAVCRVTGEDRASTMSLRTSRNRTFSHVEHERMLASDLDSAQVTNIVEFGGAALPPLLQTQEYALQVLRHSPGVSAAEVGSILDYRSRACRQLRRSDSIPTVFYIHERAFNLELGDSEMMAEQYQHLLEVGKTRRCQIHIVPISAGPYPGLLGGSWTQVTFERAPTTVRIFDEAGARFAEGDEQTLAYQDAVLTLETMALSITATRNLIIDLLETKEAAEMSESR